MSLVVTILCGGRPQLLGRTLRSLDKNARSVVSDAKVIAFLNGDDAASAQILSAHPWIDQVVERRGEPRLPIGRAVSFLMEQARLDQHQHLLHLEDDWECLRAGWLTQALSVLRLEKKVGQVRLRKWLSNAHPEHAVSRYHMVTRAPIRWEQSRNTRLNFQLARAHFTFNPSIVPTAVACRLFPCESELDAATKFHRTRLVVAQLMPGAFRHLGVGALSLRERTGGL